MSQTEPSPSPRRSRRTSGSTRAFLAGGAVIALLLASCASTVGGSGASPSPEMVTPPSPTAPSSQAATPTSTTPTPDATSFDEGPHSVPVYFLSETPQGTRLVRERRLVTGDPLMGAVEAMVEGPLDPDYVSFWDPAVEVRAAFTEAGVVIIDLSAAARDVDVSRDIAEFTVQQLVYTATAGRPDSNVRLLIDGDAADQLWGTVSWTGDVERAEAQNVLSPLQVDLPAEGEFVTREETTISGEALAGTSVTWQVSFAGGDQVASGEVPVPDGDGFVPFSFPVPLGVGRYTVELEVHEAGDPEGNVIAVESRDFSVHLAA
ncbi:MAG TPA: GerMN domain-containing protein [Actinomycetaceae bacterium]|nr:GerMN domain-containing protein [Actinomycetaceae bacterium]